MSDDEVEQSLEEEFSEAFENAREEDTEEDVVHPAQLRGGAKGGATVRDEEELSQTALEAESKYRKNLEKQHSRASWFENLEDQLMDTAGRENLPVVSFLADAQATGKAGVDDDWSVNSAKYLVGDDGEPIEFAEEDQDLLNYFHTISGEIDNRTEQVNTFTTLMGNVSDKQDQYEERVETQLEEAEETKEERIEEAETEYEEAIEEAEETKDEEVDALKSQVANQSSSDLEGSRYEDTDEMWEEEWDDISGEFKDRKQELEEEKEEEIEEAKSEYDEIRNELEEEKEEKLSDFKEQRETLRENKQQAVSERAERLDELEEVHVEFSNDVIEYVKRQAESLKDITVTLGSLENMSSHYSSESVAVDEELRGSLDQDQQAVAGEIAEAANSMARRALERIDYLEDAVTEYAQATEAITDMLDEQDARVSTRLDEVRDLYDNLGIEVEGEDDYGIEGLRERVRDHVESATGTEYDAIDEFRQEIESMARAP